MAASPDPVISKYDRLARVYDSRWAGYVAASIGRTLDRLALEAGQRVLDVGCGTGQLLAALAAGAIPVRLMGIDSSAEMLAVARRRLPPTVMLARAGADRLPLRAASLDRVVSTNVFHYVRDPVLAVAEWARVLKPDGRLVVTDWCDDYLACKVCDRLLRVFSRAHVRVYTRRECEALLREGTFEQVRAERYRLNWMWGLMTATAVRGRPDEGSAGSGARR